MFRFVAMDCRRVRGWGVLVGLAALLLVSAHDGTETHAETATGIAPMNEVYWVAKIAKEHFAVNESAVEVRLFNRKRVDLIWKDYAIEADWSYKFTEGIGQALYYAHVTHRKPGLLLLVKDTDKGIADIRDALLVCRANDPQIRLWAYDTTKDRFMTVSDPP